MKQKLKIFFDNFGLLAEAPNNIPKLRELILQLAVQGKLVPQNPNDEPASVLLEKIKAEKGRLITEKKIKKHKPFPPIASDYMPYKLPKNWKWQRLRQISYDLGQKVPDRVFSYIDVAAINKEDGSISDNIQVLDPDQAPSRARKIVDVGTVIYATVRPYLLNIAIVDRKFDPEPIVSTAFFVLKPFDGISEYYLRYYLRSHTFIHYVNDAMKGMAYPAVNDREMSIAPVPIPPLAEQKRIVAKVDDLMTLCDELESQKQQRQETRRQFNNAALAKLTAAAKPAEFKRHWQRIRDHFNLLYDTPETVTQLRQTILQLAVQGKLVPQNPNDEPASVLLEKIKAEKDRLIVEKKIKNPKPLPPIDPAEIPYELSSGWEWVRLGDVLLKLTDGTHHSPPNYSTGDYMYVTAKNIKNDGIDLTDITYVTKEVHTEIYDRCNPEYGNILYIKDGATTGILTINELREPFSMLSSVALLKQPKEIYNRYMLYALRAPYFYNIMRNDMSGVAITRVTLTKMGAALFPLPPLAEQKRIVAKVDILMILCDELESKLKQSQSDSEKLMSSIVHHLLVA